MPRRTAITRAMTNAAPRVSTVATAAPAMPSCGAPHRPRMSTGSSTSVTAMLTGEQRERRARVAGRAERRVDGEESEDERRAEQVGAEIAPAERRDVRRHAHDREQLRQQEQPGAGDRRRPSSSENTSALPAARAAPAPSRSPCRRAATAVSPTLTISPTAMTSQIQNTDVDTAASALAPRYAARPSTCRPT